jgi:hypothetical protein
VGGHLPKQKGVSYRRPLGLFLPVLVLAGTFRALALDVCVVVVVVGSWQLVVVVSCGIKLWAKQMEGGPVE